MKRSELFDKVNNTFDECKKIVQSKNLDYSKDTDAFSNFKRAENFGVKASLGIMVRISDKMARMENLLTKEAHVKDETIIDTIHDAINYLALLKECLIEEEKDGQ